MSQGFAKEQTENVTFADTHDIDAFGRLRVSTPDYRFDGQLVYQISPDIWDSAFTPGGGTVTHSRTNKMGACTVYATGSAVLQSHYHSPYTPGRSQLAFMTFVFGTNPGGGATRRAGYWDGSNGVYLQQSTGTISLVNATTTGYGNETVTQANWNRDKFDGTGPSGLTLDLTRTQIMAVSLQALYSGRAIIAFDIGGELWPAHEFLHANIGTTPYIGQASLPIRYEAMGTGTGITLNPICASIISEGGGEIRNIPARTFSGGTGASTLSTSTRRPIVSVRPLKFFNQIPNNGIMLPISLSAVSASQSSFVELVRNATLTGASFSPVDTGNSFCEVDTSATALSGGTTVFSTYSVAGAGVPIALSENVLSRLVICYSHLMDQADTISIVGTALSGTAQTSASLTWKEIR